MRRLRIVLDFVADATPTPALGELRGYLKTMAQDQHLGVSLGIRTLESLGLAGVRLVEAAFETEPSAEERVVTGRQRASSEGPALISDTAEE